MFMNQCFYTGVPVREMILSAMPYSFQQRKLVTSKGSSLIDSEQVTTG
jgi:hypothetical protein